MEGREKNRDWVTMVGLNKTKDKRVVENSVRQQKSWGLESCEKAALTHHFWGEL